MLEVELLGPGHDRAGFRSGVEALDRYLHQTARQHFRKGIARTFVLVDGKAEPPKPVLGFFSLSLCQVLVEALLAGLAKNLPRQLPAMKLGRLAVAESERGKGYGKALLIEALERAQLVAAQAAGIGVFVDARDTQAAAFYAHFGFEPAPGKPLSLFLPMQTVDRLLK